MAQAKYVIAIIAMCLLAACSRSVPFDKIEWNTEVLKEDEVSTTVSFKRYGMALWLSRHYDFCGKSIVEIADKLIENPTEQMADSIKASKRLSFLIREKNRTWLIGFAEWVQTDWLEIYFDDSGYVHRACIVHINPDSKQRTEKIICK